MNDVAHPTFVTVKRPVTMLPVDFKLAIADLARIGLVDVHVVAGDHAVVEKRDVAEVPLERELAAEVVEVTDGVDRADPRRDRDSSAETLNEHAASAAHEEDMPKDINVREMVRTLVAEGVTTTKDLCAAEDLAGVDRVAIQNAVTAMKTKGEIVMTGRGEFQKSKTGSGGAIAMPRKRASKGTAMVHAPKVSDLSRAPAGSGARFTLRYFHAHVECASAQDVAELLGALKAFAS